MARVVITRETVEGMVKDGITVSQLAPGTIVTDAASEYARDRGVRLIPAGLVGEPGAKAADAHLAARVRSGVIAQLGHVPEGLDAVIARVLASL